MNIEIILVGIVVGIANFASRFGPFFVIQKFQQGSQKLCHVSRLRRISRTLFQV